jgi:hypothetical protein
MTSNGEGEETKAEAKVVSREREKRILDLATLLLLCRLCVTLGSEPLLRSGYRTPSQKGELAIYGVWGKALDPMCRCPDLGSVTMLVYPALPASASIIIHWLNVSCKGASVLRLHGRGGMVRVED